MNNLQPIRTHNGILLPKLFLPTVTINCSSDRENILKFVAEGLEVCKNFEITRIIYSNSKRSEQILVTKCFFNLFLEVFSDITNQNNSNSNWKTNIGI